MVTKHNSFAKHFRKYTVAVLLIVALLICSPLAVYAESTVEVSGNTGVTVETCSVSHSNDAMAWVVQDGNDRIAIQAILSVPGDWACFTFTVENSGSVDVRLTDVIRTVDAPDDLLVTFGITEKDVGEVLKAGERCEFSIVAQLNPEKEDSLPVSDHFALTLVYKASNTAGDGDVSEDQDEADGKGDHKLPQTGDSLILAIGCMLLSATLLLILIPKRRREKDEQKRDNRISE